MSDTKQVVINMTNEHHEKLVNMLQDAGLQGNDKDIEIHFNKIIEIMHNMQRKNTDGE